LLAMGVNDNPHCLNKRATTAFSSKDVRSPPFIQQSLPTHPRPMSPAPQRSVENQAAPPCHKVAQSTHFTPQPVPATWHFIPALHKKPGVWAG
jgi:hypothetical protein